MTLRRALVVALALRAAPASACGTCSVAMFDWALPPGWLWFFLPLSWFLATAVAARFSTAKLRFAPSIAGAIGASAAALVVGFAALGPVATLPLGLWAAAVLAVSFQRSQTRPRPASRALAAVGLLHVTVLIAGAAYGISVRSVRSPGQYVCEWPGTAPARSVFASLESRPDAAPSYRYIARNAPDTRLVLEAAEALSRTGDSSDIALLGALAAQYEHDSKAKERLGNALATLRGRTAQN